MSNVRDSLRRELESQGFDVASDTVASRGELYVTGEGDLALALFEFKRSARDAMDTMYQGRWTEGLPPRFAVLPVRAADDPYFELLEQARIVPLLYEMAEESVTFVDLQRALDHLRR